MVRPQNERESHRIEKKDGQVDILIRMTFRPQNGSETQSRVTLE